MSMIRLNITMPDSLADQLKDIKNKSQFIAEALREKFQREQKSKLEKLLIEGYKAEFVNDKSINAEWEDGTLNDGLDE